MPQPLEHSGEGQQINSNEQVWSMNGINELVKNYLLERDDGFGELISLKEKVGSEINMILGRELMWSQGWSNPNGDEHFKQQRHRADKADEKACQRFFSLMSSIGSEMNQATGAYEFGIGKPKVLDLCMAPGGYSKSILKRHPYARVDAVTLPRESGGHKVLLQDSRVRITFADINTLAAEYGVQQIPDNHPEATTFTVNRPYIGNAYDLIFCDGQVLRPDVHTRPEYRETKEATRLTIGQLILALQRIRVGGTLIILLHKVDSWYSVNVIRAFDKFSKVQLFKPLKAHRMRSSFYLIAKQVQPQHPEAVRMVHEWKRAWYNATFESQESHIIEEMYESKQEVSTIIEEFGPRLMELGHPIWAIQAGALKEASFMNC